MKIAKKNRKCYPPGTGTQVKKEKHFQEAQSAWVLALAQISQPQASICFVVARIPLRGSQEELAAAQSGEKPKYL